MPRGEGNDGRRRPRAAVKALVMLVLWRLGALRRRSRSRHEERREREVDVTSRETGAPRSTERTLLVLMAATALLAVSFALLFVLDPQTQLLGASLGGALALLA